MQPVALKIKKKDIYFDKMDSLIASSVVYMENNNCTRLQKKLWEKPIHTGLYTNDFSFYDYIIHTFTGQWIARDMFQT